MLWLKKSTAVTVMVGPFVDDTDGKTAETGLTISQADVRLSKNGAAFAQKNESTSATHDENGYYTVPLDTTDTGTAGILVLAVAESGALPVRQEFMVYAANTYDSLVSGSDYIDANAVEVSGDSTAADNLEAMLDGTGGVTLTTAITGDITGDLSGSVGSVTGAVGSVTGNVGGNVAGSVNSVTTQVTANVAQISGDTAAADNLEAMLDGTGGVTLTTAITGDITGDLSGSVGSVTGAVGSVTGNVGGNVAGSVDSVTNAVTITANQNVNVNQIGGDATAASNLKNTALSATVFTVNDAAASNTAFITDLSEATDDHYNERYIIGVDGVCAGQLTKITDYTGATKTVTVTAMTDAPGNGDTFVML